MKWTAEDVPDLGGRVAVVTGANSGLGYETSVVLAERGAEVVMACRSAERGEAALGRLRAAVPRARVELRLLDVASLESVRRFASELVAARLRLDLLVNNAGVMALPRREETADGFEMQFATNHLGHFALTGRLLPALLAAPGARVVSVTSNAHRLGSIAFDDLDGKRRYRRWVAYCQSKLANLLFARELARRAEAAGVDLVAAVAHPGFASTHLQEGTSFGPWRRFAQPASQGALPILYAATAPDVSGGEYFGPDGLMRQSGHPKRERPSRRARDPELARRLWDVSEELAGVRYDALGQAVAA